MAYGILEILLVAVLTELSLRKFKKRGVIIYILNSLFMLFINIQAVCLYFGRSYLTIVMLTNVDSIEDLSGNALQYISGVILVLILSFLPITTLRKTIKVNFRQVLPLILSLELILAMANGNGGSPLWGYITIAENAKAAVDFAHNPSESSISAKSFYCPDIVDSVKKPAALGDKPNIILIFVEGLSQSIIDDERDIMPNVRKYEKKSLFFENYYNHTFATYRGLEGTLFSGYQLNNYDVNGLVSLQGVLRKNGYYTEFINTEPNNRRFQAYLEALGFDFVKSDVSQSSSYLESLSDKGAYEILFSEASALSEKNASFLLCIYTFGTHISFDSKDEVFGDGTNPLLNKFYDNDFQFNEFMEKFNRSNFSDNTIIVFTADHATHAEREFSETFPDYKRKNTDVDKIPFFIYYKEMTSQVIDAGGRNSLDLTPTLLDYIDISEPNYFLGIPLFFNKENNTNFDTIFWDTSFLLSTDNGNITDISEKESSIIQKQLNEYFNAMKFDSGMVVQ